MKKVCSILLAIAMLAVCVMPTMAAEMDFVPSIEIKPGPGIVEDPADSGNGGVIIMPDGTEVIVPISAIIITPIAEADGADDHIRDALKDAYADITGASSLDEIISDLQTLLDQLTDGILVDDVVIADLFHVDLIGDYAKYVEEGGILEITFDATTDIAIAFSKIGGAWDSIYGDALVLNEDGTVTLKIGSIGVYAFLKNVKAVDVDPENPDVSSPTTGDNGALYLGVSAVFAALATLAFVAYKKQKA